MVRLTDRPDMTLDVYRGCKTTTQHYYSALRKFSALSFASGMYLCNYGVKIDSIGRWTLEQ